MNDPTTPDALATTVPRDPVTAPLDGPHSPLSVRAANLCYRHGVTTLLALSRLSRATVRAWSGAGPMVVRELSDAVASVGLAWAGEPATHALVPIGHVRTLVLGAFRYAIGRQTAMPGLVAGAVRSAYPALDRHLVTLMVDEINEAERRGDLGSDGYAVEWTELRSWLLARATGEKP